MSNYGVVAAQLEERLSRLLRRVGNIQGDLRSAHDRDWAERASEVANDDVLEGLDELSRKEVRQILTTLKRIESGHYGVCAACGQPIGAKRLTAIPTAVTCVGCAPQ